MVFSLLTIILGIALAFACYHPIISFLTAPLHSEVSTKGVERQILHHERILNHSTSTQTFQLPNQAKALASEEYRTSSENLFLIPPGKYLDIEVTSSPHFLVVLGPLEGLLTSLKVSFWVGLVLSSPFWISFMIRFILPALYPKERRLVTPFLALSFLFLGIGCAFGYYITLPLANHYLRMFNQGIGVNFWSLSHYLDYTLSLILANALAFEIAVILLFLVQSGIVTAETLISKRRHVIVGAFVVGALLTPPDILTQFLLAIPLILLYEVILLYARLTRKTTSVSVK